MIGGFGAASDFSWDVLALSATSGRSLYLSSEAIGRSAWITAATDSRFDVIEHGPILGAVIRF